MPCSDRPLMGARYSAVLETQENDALLVRFVDLDDTFTEGATLDEALFNAAEVLSALLGCRLDHDLADSRAVSRRRGHGSRRAGRPDPSGLADPPGARGAVPGRTRPLAANLLAFGATAGESPPLSDPAPTGENGGGPGQGSGTGLGMLPRTLQRRLPCS